ncbi:MAG: helicase-related protein [bacterium]
MSAPYSFINQTLDRPVIAVLGPTNTGKTHYALERMAAHDSGMIGLPLRLLAREVYDKMVLRKNRDQVALVTGEEKIIPKNAKYFVCTVEAMPLEREVAFMAIDEVQLAADLERGRIFTERLLHARGTAETLLLGSDTMRLMIKRLIPDAGFLSRERFSHLDYAGHKKVTRLPHRTAIVAFSSDSVYSIAELIRRQRGGAAVVLGALSPRTRNAQAALYQSGEVDFLVATDAIGMGLNMDIDHVAFAGISKFDGRQSRRLLPAEMGQIAGRAGRHIRDGSFGTTADCEDLDTDIATAITEHDFPQITALQWRSAHRDFNSLPALLHSLERRPSRPELVRARLASDEDALRRLTKNPDIADKATGGAGLKLLWDVCQTPDFRKVSPDQHADRLGEIFGQLIERGQIAERWLRPRLERLDRIDGNLDTLSNRLSQIRTWTYLTHRPHWLENSTTWQERARAIEDRLSDALHEKLTQQFIDRRTSILLKKLKDNAPLLAGVTPEGEVIVEGEFTGRLIGFQFILDPRAKGPQAKAIRHAAMTALQPELAARASALIHAKDEEFSLVDGTNIWWRQSIIARLAKGPVPLRPEIKLIAVENLPANSLPRIEERLRNWFTDRLEGLLMPLLSLQKAVNKTGSDEETLASAARGIGYRLIENFGAISRHQISDEVKTLEQTERAKLRKLGVRFGEFTIYMPLLLKPAPAQLLTTLWALWNDKKPGDFPLPKAGLTSVPRAEEVPHAFWYASGYRPSGTRAVRIDMLERLAQEIRTAREQADMREGFEATPKMLSFVGCSGEEFESILKSLGFRKNKVTKTRPVITPTKAGQAAENTVTQDETLPTVDTSTVGVASLAENEKPLPEGQQDITPEQSNPSAPAATDTGETGESATIKATGASDVPVTSDAARDNIDATNTDERSVEEVELTLWKLAPRHFQKPRKFNNNKNDTSPAQHNKGQKGKGPAGDNKKRKSFTKGPRKGKSTGASKGPRTYTVGETKKRIEDSPFAALANFQDDD